MHEQLRDKEGPARAAYRRRAAVECVNSMIKRNGGSDLRARTAAGREREMLLKAVVHNTMLLRRRRRGSRQSPPDHFICRVSQLRYRKRHGQIFHQSAQHDAYWILSRKPLFRTNRRCQ